MWLTLAMLLAPAIWFNIQAETEILRNGLPVNCGRKSPLQPTPANYDGSKRKAIPHSWPWHVGLYFSEFGAYPYCGGTLISPTWVLTSAHCMLSIFDCQDIPLGRPIPLDEFTNETLAVSVGSHNFKNNHSRATNVVVKHVILHPNFPLNGPKMRYDYALLKLKREVERSPTVEFACLPESGLKFDYGKECFIVGWGLIALSASEMSDQPEELMEMTGKIGKAEDCKALFKTPFSMKNLCVLQSLSTHCIGDSGGGLHCPIPDGTWTLYGLISYGDTWCYKGAGVFASMEYALTWVKTTIQVFN